MRITHSTRWGLSALAIALFFALAACSGDTNTDPGAEGDDVLNVDGSGSGDVGAVGDDASVGTDTTGTDNGGGNVDVGGGTIEWTDTDPVEPPEEIDFSGATDFVSADGNNGEESPEGGTGAGGPDRETAFDDAAPDDRTVEEGDIYRVLAGNLILNLNSYRGLQVIDFADPSAPEVIGRAQVSGTPVELYVVGDFAYVLLNNWQAYYGARDDIRVDSYSGGLVVSVDLTDPTSPSIVDRQPVSGWIDTSRMTRGGGGTALYAVANDWGYFDEGPDAGWEQRTVVKSFSLDGGDIDPVSEIVMDGYTPDIQATTRALLVAQHNWSVERPHSTVTVIDITDPNGVMDQGDMVQVGGIVSHKSRMDLRGDVLRVVSGSTWSGTQTNHLQTFAADNLEELTKIDHCEFGSGQNLFATIFLDDRAFFVTYLRVDPFHAFAIDAEGKCEEKAEFIVSGWNNFFRSVFEDQRLIGIGVNDEDGRTLAVSLYDITDLTNTEPLIERASVAADNSWSEANWDDRAFSVLEDVVSVRQGDVEETGLVLLPFSGWREDRGEYLAAVQIFTFSDSTLTRRGMMVHGTPVRRSFLADDEITANLSELELSLFDHTDPDEPSELGRVNLAPNYTDLLVFGDYGARLNNTSEFYWGWYGAEAEVPASTIEMISLDDDPDTAEAVASFEVPGGASVYQVGDSLVTAVFEILDSSEWPYTYETTLTVWDLSDPAEPSERGTVVTEGLSPSNNYYWGWGGAEIDCFGPCRPWPSYGNADWVYPVGDAVVFVETVQEQELLGTEHVCNTYGVADDCRSDDWRECQSYRGAVSCRNLEDEDPTCTGTIYACSNNEEGEWACDEVDADGIETVTNCYDYERYRYWQRYELEILNLSDLDEPVFEDTYALPVEDEGVSAFADGNHLWVTIKRPYTVEGDSRGYVKYFIRDLDLDDPSSPALGEPINVPGELIAASGRSIYTRDTVYGAEIVESAVARLVVRDGLAYLQAVREFPDQELHAILLDGTGHVLVSHRLPWQVAYDRGIDENLEQLTILDARELDVESRYEIDTWATLQDAVAGRALFQVPGGVLIINTEDAESPWAQAFFAVRGWPSEFLLEEDRLLFAAGRFGIYDFDLSESNWIDVL